MRRPDASRAEPDRHRWRPAPLIAASAGLHSAALAALIASPRSWDLALAAVLGNHLALGAVGLLPRCGWLGPNMSRLPASAERDGLVALTFDDGPDPEVTPAVLELLDQAGARATFFCVGSRVETHPGVVAAIRAKGHGLENHTYSHPNGFAFRGPTGLRLEILRAQDAIEQAGGNRPTFFRAPAGIQNPWLSWVLAAVGLSLVSWSRRGFDTVTRDPARVAARLGRNLRAGSILLLHDRSSARDAKGRPVVLEALARILEQMDRKDLHSEALHAILQKRACEER